MGATFLMKTRCILPCVVLCPIDTSDFTLDFFRLVSLFELQALSDCGCYHRKYGVERRLGLLKNCNSSRLFFLLLEGAVAAAPSLLLLLLLFLLLLFLLLLFLLLFFCSCSFSCSSFSWKGLSRLSRLNSINWGHV